MYKTEEILLVIIIIGLATLIIRASFLYRLPDLAKHPLVRRGMDAVPAGMLVALVIPFTFFVDQRLVLWRAEVVAIVGTIPVVYVTKKYAYGLAVAVIVFLLMGVVP